MATEKNPQRKCKFSDVNNYKVSPERNSKP